MRRNSERSPFCTRKACVGPIVALVAAMLTMVPAVVHAKPTPAQKCRAAKLRAAQKLSACLLQAKSKAALKDLPVDATNCVAKFTTAFDKAEVKGGASCPTIGDAATIAARLEGLANDVASAVTGQTPTPTPTASPPTASVRLNMTVNATYPRGPGSSSPHGPLNLSDPAATLVMPFDVIDGKTSTLVVSRVAPSDLDPLPATLIVTHWSFWEERGDHLSDLFICLAPNDTVAVDPTAMRGQTQEGGTNVPLGPILNLSGYRGFVAVSTYEKDPMTDCTPLDYSSPLVAGTIVGSWSIGSPQHPGAIGGSAVGFLGAFPDAHVLNGDSGSEGGIALQSIDPGRLSHSQVILIGLEAGAGNGQFNEVEIGPIERLGLGNCDVSCSVKFIDDVADPVGLADVCFDGMLFAGLVDHATDPDDVVLMPDFLVPSGPGTLRLTSCRTVLFPAGLLGPIGTGARSQFLVGFHGQTIR